jgi:phospholipid transport system substrate-binding protein
MDPTMLKIVKNIMALYLVAAASLVLAQAETAQQQPVTAHSVVRAATMEVMAVVQAADEYVEDEPERYYGEVQAVLDPVVDFRGFARSVMGPYASSERYRSLDEGGRAELKTQLDDFTQVMRIGLIRTYSKGLLAFGGSRIEVSSASAEEVGQTRISVQQLIFSEESKPYVVMYQMGLDRAGDWKLRNMIIESVNLGEIYRNQFEASARKFEGDLNQVIASWNDQALDT